jgi:DNA-binding MarR family transcriptional regulator
MEGNGKETVTSESSKAKGCEAKSSDRAPCEARPVPPPACTEPFTQYWRPEPPRSALRLADRLQTAALHLLRRLRAADETEVLSGPRLSALSVIVFARGMRMSELAAAEQVTAATITRLVQGLVRDGLARTIPDPHDGRMRLVEPTPKGVTLLRKSREQRVAGFARELVDLRPEEIRVLRRDAPNLERIAFSDDHPTQLG